MNIELCFNEPYNKLHCGYGVSFKWEGMCREGSELTSQPEKSLCIGCSFFMSNKPSYNSGTLVTASLYETSPRHALCSRKAGLQSDSGLKFKFSA